MRYKRALKVLSKRMEDFDISEEVYAVDYYAGVFKVTIVGRIENKLKIFSNYRYTYYSSEYNRLLKSACRYMYRKKKDALKCLKAIKTIREQDDKENRGI